MKAEWVETGDGLNIKVTAENDVDRVNFSQLFFHRKPYSKLRVNNTLSGAGGSIYQLTVGNIQFLDKKLLTEYYKFSGWDQGSPFEGVYKVIGNAVVVLLNWNVSIVKKVVFNSNKNAEGRSLDLFTALKADKYLETFEEKPVQTIGYARTVGDLKTLLNLKNL